MTVLFALLLLLLQKEAPTFSIQPEELRSAVVGRDYFQELALSPPIRGVTWMLAQGELPEGVELVGREERALLVGRPTISGEFEFSVSVWNESGQLTQGAYQLTVLSYDPAAPRRAPAGRPEGVTGSVLGIVDSALKMAESFARSGAPSDGSSEPGEAGSEVAPGPALPPSEPPSMRPAPATEAETEAETETEAGGQASSSRSVPEQPKPRPPEPAEEPRAGAAEKAAAATAHAEHPAEIAWQILLASEAEYQKVRSYQCLFIKQERSPSGLGTQEQIRYYFRKPFSVRMEWTAGPHKGRKAVYVKGQNDDRLLVREGGLLGLITVRLDPHGSTAMRGEHHPITESGIGEALRLIRDNFKRGREAGEVEVELLGEKQQDGRSLKGLRVSFSTHAARPYYCAKAEVWGDTENKLPHTIITYDAQGRVYERYVFSQLQLNPSLASHLFSL